MDDPRPVRVLVVEDDAALLRTLDEELRARGYAVVAAQTLAAGLAELDAADYEVAIVDLVLPDGNGIDVLRRIVERQLATEAIVLTGYASLGSAIEAMQLGAYDYLAKPGRMDELDLLVRKAAEKGRLRRENDALRIRVGRLDGGTGIVTDDPAMKELLATVERVASSYLPVLIEGEAGTGKELVARALHAAEPARHRALRRRGLRRGGGDHAGGRRCSATSGHARRRRAQAGPVRGRRTGACSSWTRSAEVPPGGAGEAATRRWRAARCCAWARRRPVRVDVRIVSATHRDLKAEVRGRPLPRGPVHRS